MHNGYGHYCIYNLVLVYCYFVGVLMLRFLLGMVLGASAASGLGLQIVMGTIGLGFMFWGFYAMLVNGELE
jgi:hypothetical protein